MELTPTLLEKGFDDDDVMYKHCMGGTTVQHFSTLLKCSTLPKFMIGVCHPKM